MWQSLTNLTKLGGESLKGKKVAGASVVSSVNVLNIVQSTTVGKSGCAFFWELEVCTLTLPKEEHFLSNCFICHLIMIADSQRSKILTTIVLPCDVIKTVISQYVRILSSLSLRWAEASPWPNLGLGGFLNCSCMFGFSMFQPRPSCFKKEHGRLVDMVINLLMSGSVTTFCAGTFLIRSIVCWPQTVLSLK